MKKVSLSLALVAALANALSLRPALNTPPTQGTWRRVPRTLLRSTTSAATNLEQTQDVRAQAMKRLQTLRVRQLEELKETENLLKRFNATLDENFMRLDGDDEARSLSTARSIMSGVDYGFQSRSEGATFSELQGGMPSFEGYGPPANIWKVGWSQFFRNLNAMRNEYEEEKDMVLTPKQEELQAKLSQLTLNSTSIWEKEKALGPIKAPYLIKIPYITLCWFLDHVFEGKYPPSRFYLLETVARMPYFSYITMLHLYETLGFWRRSADMKRVHFAEELNEYRHLLIMESIGGDQHWWVRFLSQHSAIAYYIGLCLLWLISPSLSYRFSELLETHAVFTYGQFLEDNEKILKELPPSLSAIEYYSFGTSDPFYAEFQTTALIQGNDIRRPGENMHSLYDVFAAIRADEGDHVSTMQACLDPNASLRSPSIERRLLFGLSLVAAVGFAVSVGDGSETARVGEVVNNAGGTEGLSAFGADGFVESIAAGIAGIFGSVASSLPQDSGMVESSAEFLEETPGARSAMTQVFERLFRIFL